MSVMGLLEKRTAATGVAPTREEFDWALREDKEAEREAERARQAAELALIEATIATLREQRAAGCAPLTGGGYTRGGPAGHVHRTTRSAPRDEGVVYLNSTRDSVYPSERKRSRRYE